MTATAVIKLDGCLRMRYQPIYKKNGENGKLMHVVANGSNTELVPLFLGPKYASHFVTVSKHNHFPRCGISTRTPVPNDVFKDTSCTDYFGALPRKLDLGHQLDIVEGFIFNQETCNTFKS